MLNPVVHKVVAVFERLIIHEDQTADWKIQNLGTLLLL
jgi:hypothetical protein